VVYSRVSIEKTEFIGSEAFEDNIRVDDTALRTSYKALILARISLIPREDGSVPVSHITIDGKSVWYIYDEKRGLVYLESDTFFRAGEDATEYIIFWYPIEKRIRCVVF